MENIKINLIINSKKVIGKEKVKNKLYLICENNDRIVRKDINSILVVCDVCKFKTKFKNIPDNFIINKDTYLCKSCRNKGDKNPVFGKKWSDDRKLSRSIKYSGEGNPMCGKNYYDIWVNEYGEEYASEKMNEYKKNIL